MSRINLALTLPDLYLSILLFAYLKPQRPLDLFSLYLQLNNIKQSYIQTFGFFNIPAGQ